MPFPDDVIKDAWELVEGKCECSKANHNHPEVRCNKRLTFEKRGEVGWGGWEASPIDGNPENNRFSNCQILCWDCRMR